jgi:hypothetical protein
MCCMNKFILAIALLCIISCSKDGDDPPDNNNNNNPPGSCGTYNGYQLYKDTNGCYYSDGYGPKVYVDAGLCDC